MGCDFRFAHVADLHLGSRFKGISGTDPEAGRRMQESVFESFHRIVDIAKDRTDFMVVSGDLYDEAYMSPRTRYRFSEEARRYGKPVFVVKGNHDFGDSWEDSIPYPENVRLFPSKPAIFAMTINGRRVEVTGISYPQWHTTDNLAVRLRGNGNAYTVAVLHCSVKEVAESEEYAPCSVSDLVGRNVDYWALGHIHKRTVVRESGPAIVYPGNIQGRNPNESGEKGFYIASVTGSTTELEFVPTQSILWKDETVDITGMRTFDELASSVSAPAGSIVSLSVRGRGPLNSLLRSGRSDLNEQLSAMTGAKVSISSVSTSPDIDIERARSGSTILSEVVRTGDAISRMSVDEIVDLICTGPAEDIREEVRALLASGKSELVSEAVDSLVSRIAEAGQ